MPIKISRLRLWFAVGVICVTGIVAGAYFYARWRVENALKEVPGKMGFEFQQTAQGFTFSKSDGPRTLFKIQAGKAVKYKKGGRLELHDVTITVYGSDSDRFDQLHGQDFVYDPQTGDATAQGEVRIDLEANPAGLTGPDQSPPQQPKSSVHLQTSGLVFNQKTGNAHTIEPIAFQIPEGNGSAEGFDYAAKTGTLTLEKNVTLAFTGPRAAKINAESATINKGSRSVVLKHPQVETSSGHGQSGSATLFLRSDNSLELISANNGVNIDLNGQQAGEAHAENLKIALTDDGQNVKQAVLTGDVRMAFTRPQEVQGKAARVILDFGKRNRVKTIHTEGGVELVEWQKKSKGIGPDQKMTDQKTAGQKVELTAPAVDFVVANGHRLQRTWTTGASQIVLPAQENPEQGKTNPETIVTAGEFEGHFNPAGQLISVHGAPDVRVVSQTGAQQGKIQVQTATRERVSTSDMLDTILLPGNGIQSLVQQGNVVYKDGERQAWADRGAYTPSDHILLLSGSPRVEQGNMSVTSQSMRFNQLTREIVAQGNVKTTYNQPKSSQKKSSNQPKALNQSKPSPANETLSASSSPIHVTAETMMAHGSPVVALYSGDARLWQDANMVQAPSIEFDQEQNQVIAQSSSNARVSTTLTEVDSKGEVIPVTITCARLVYAGRERKIHLLGGAAVKGPEVLLTSSQMEVSLGPPNAKTGESVLTSAGKIEEITASGNVLITQPDRKATGERLTYTPADDKFVLAGNSPSIFDAEHGKITGVSLTFFRHDDRVLVEGSQRSPAVTRTRVAR